MQIPRLARHGFTIIELLVVLAAIALLLSVVGPRYLQHLDTAREVALKQDLFQIRDSIDKFYADQGRYPNSLGELVERRYLRSVPLDPLTERVDTWVLVGPKSGAAGCIYDVKSGAPGKAMDGSGYGTW